MKKYKVTFSDGSSFIVEAVSGRDAETKMVEQGLTVTMVVPV